MPLNNPAPNFALLTAYDLRDFSGEQIFTRSGGQPVSMPTFTTGQGVYEDLIFFLNNRSTQSPLTATGQITSSKTFGSTWSVGINEDDKIQITSDVDFTIINQGSVDAFGIGSNTLSASQVGSNYIATAPNDWTRGTIQRNDVSYLLNEVSGSNTFTFPIQGTAFQDVTTYVRDRSSISDLDVFGFASLELQDVIAQSNDLISWVINDSGFTECIYRSNLGDISWTNTTIRDLLGFTGNETPATHATTFSKLTATHKASGVLIPSRPLQGHHLRVSNLSQSRRKIGGGYVSNYIGTYTTSALQFDLDALLDVSDDYRHFTDRWLPLCSSGERVNLYQSWGDSRRALVSAEVLGTQAAFDTLFTSESNGLYGRVRGSLITADFDLSYPGRLRRRVPVAMEIEHL